MTDLSYAQRVAAQHERLELLEIMVTHLLDTIDAHLQGRDADLQLAATQMRALLRNED